MIKDTFNNFSFQQPIKRLIGDTCHNKYIKRWNYCLNKSEKMLIIYFFKLKTSPCTEQRAKNKLTKICKSRCATNKLQYTMYIILINVNLQCCKFIFCMFLNWIRYGIIGWVKAHVKLKHVHRYFISILIFSSKYLIHFVCLSVFRSYYKNYNIFLSKLSWYLNIYKTLLFITLCFTFFMIIEYLLYNTFFLSPLQIWLLYYKCFMSSSSFLFLTRIIVKNQDLYH